MRFHFFFDKASKHGIVFHAMPHRVQERVYIDNWIRYPHFPILRFMAKPTRLWRKPRRDDNMEDAINKSHGLRVMAKNLKTAKLFLFFKRRR